MKLGLPDGPDAASRETIKRRRRLFRIATSELLGDIERHCREFQDGVLCRQEHSDLVVGGISEVLLPQPLAFGDGICHNRFSFCGPSDRPYDTRRIIWTPVEWFSCAVFMRQFPEVVLGLVLFRSCILTRIEHAKQHADEVYHPSLEEYKKAFDLHNFLGDVPIALYCELIKKSAILRDRQGECTLADIDQILGDAASIAMLKREMDSEAKLDDLIERALRFLVKAGMFGVSHTVTDYQITDNTCPFAHQKHEATFEVSNVCPAKEFVYYNFGIAANTIDAINRSRHDGGSLNVERLISGIIDVIDAQIGEHRKIAMECSKVDVDFVPKPVKSIETSQCRYRYR
ncbi:MAG: hypothetical protein OER86_02725 [Phycisphaerae bacterium]|nr:hypothetical protein [Phycisphaerae bacterium]